MEWTVTNVVIQIFAGILGGHAAAVAANEHSFGALGNTIAGAWGARFPDISCKHSPRLWSQEAAPSR